MRRIVAYREWDAHLFQYTLCPGGNTSIVALPIPEHESLLRRLFRRHTGEKWVITQRLKGDGSQRAIYRLFDKSESSIIGVIGPNREENDAFLSFTRTFQALSLPVPEILCEDPEKRGYLLEDLGDETLFRRLHKHREALGGVFPREEVRPLYRRAVKWLVKFQLRAAEKLDFSKCYQGAEFDEEAWLRDQRYFLHYLVETLFGRDLPREELDGDLASLRLILSSIPRNAFLYRDFQSRNIMVTPRGLVFIDYQSGRRGAVSYDIASLLLDGRANLPPDFRRELLELHTRLIARESGQRAESLLLAFAPYALMRTLQALGAYGNLGIKQGKAHFLQSIPYGLENALDLLENDESLSALRTLRDVLAKIREEKRWEIYLEEEP